MYIVQCIYTLIEVREYDGRKTAYSAIYSLGEKNATWTRETNVKEKRER